MNAEQVRARVESIRKQAGDDEAAHGAEDFLRHQVLQHIAEHGDFESAELAEIALTTTDIEFERWCA